MTRTPHPDAWGFRQIEMRMPLEATATNTATQFVRVLNETVRERGEVLNVERTAGERVAVLDVAAAKMGARWVITPDHVLVVTHGSLDRERGQ